MLQPFEWFTLFTAASLISSPSMAQARYNPSDTETFRVDRVERVVEVKGRQSVTCPKQSARTAVLFIIGQSNAGNHAEMRFRTANPSRVVNFFNGACYQAHSPLLGTTGLAGESWTLLADKLISAEVFDQIILVTSAIGGTEIARWGAGGDLNQLALVVVNDVQRRYAITHVLWSDLLAGTTTDGYAADLNSLVSSLRQAKLTAPIYVSVASKCGHSGENWSDDDAVTVAQKRVVEPGKRVYAGPNTNVLAPIADRYDQCHFNKSGQAKFADAWARILSTRE